MSRTEVTAIARPVQTLFTDGTKNHTATQWAVVTTDGIVTIEPGTDPARRELGNMLRIKVRICLFDCFSEIRPTSTFEDIGALTDQAMRRIGDHFEPTPWGVAFRYPANHQAIAAYIHKNLLTAADLALKAE